MISKVRPLLEILVQAIGGDGIFKNGLFATYPVYYEYNQIKNELNRLVFFAQNSERIQELQVKLANMRIRLDETKKLTRERDLYDFSHSMLVSSDYVLMASIVAKCLTVAFRSELKIKLKERDILSRQILATAKPEQQNNAADNNKSKKDFEEQIAKINEIIDMKRISMDVIWREFMLLYNQRPNCHQPIADKFTELLFKGQPFEIIDGDNFRFNYTFLKTIFDAQKELQLRIRVISILGPQNSGKSTLLNFMFGCDFSVSDGRCTRGIYGSFIKATDESANEFDYLLVLDTEGLQSIEKGDREYDRKLILFVFAVSNIVILNAKDQITEDFKATLEICVDSLSKIEMARVHRPAVYFVMNQKADPNKRNDQEAINKIIDGFNANGLMTQLRLNDKNFETLPSAFNSHTIPIKQPDHELRYYTTSPDFTKRVATFARTIIDQANQMAKDEYFSNIIKWIEFSYLIFDTISNYPDLTFFNTIAARKQQRQLQEFINGKLSSQLSNVVKANLFEETTKRPETSENDEKAISEIHKHISRKKTQLIRDFDDYLKKYAVSAEIKRFQKEFLVTQIDQVEDWWGNEIRIKIGEARLRREINSGEGK